MKNSRESADKEIAQNKIDTPNNGELNGTTIENESRLYTTFNERDVARQKNRLTTCSNVNLNVNITIVKVDAESDNILIKGIEKTSKIVQELVKNGRRQHTVGLNPDRRQFTIQGSASLPVTANFKATDAEEMIWKFQDIMSDERQNQLLKLEQLYCKNEKRTFEFRQFQAKKAIAASEISNMRGQLRKSNGARMNRNDFEAFKMNRRCSETGYVIKISLSYKHDINLKGDVNIDPYVSRELGQTSYPANRYHAVAGTSYKLQTKANVRTITIPFFNDKQLERLNTVLRQALLPLQQKREEINKEYNLFYVSNDEGDLLPDNSWSNIVDKYQFITIADIRDALSDNHTFSEDSSECELDDIALDIDLE